MQFQQLSLDSISDLLLTFLVVNTIIGAPPHLHQPFLTTLLVNVLSLAIM
jgi:hypothetical protein